MMKRVIVALALSIGACGTTLPAVKPPTGAPPSTCADACQHVDQDLGCQNGGACLTVCQSVEDGSYAACVAAVPALNSAGQPNTDACAQVDACGAVPTAP